MTDAIQTLRDHMQAMPLLQQAALAGVLLIGVIGGNAVFIRHRRRHGLPALGGWDTLSDLRRFDRSDWLALAAVYVAAFACAGVAMLAG